jgi:hypothetical protein
LGDVQQHARAGMYGRQALEAVRERDLAARMAAEGQQAREVNEMLLEENAALKKALGRSTKSGQESRYAVLSPIDRQALNQIKAIRNSSRTDFQHWKRPL